MTTELDPIVGNWYTRLDKGQTFVVVAFDEHARVIEIQHFDGDLEEIDLSNWYDMELEPSVAPEDWSGPVDGIERDDTGLSETQMSTEDWAKRLEENPRVADESWEDARPEDERDERADGTLAEESWKEET